MLVWLEEEEDDGVSVGDLVRFGDFKLDEFIFPDFLAFAPDAADDRLFLVSLIMCSGKCEAVLG